MRLLVAYLALLGAARADALDDLVRAEMAKRKIPALSLAVIQDGKIVKVEAYGATPTTLFQAGSISKPVSAFGALRLVERGQLKLDEDVNARLRSWKVPESDFTRVQKVTLRRLLSHTAGLTVHGFPGYAVGAAVPGLTQILDGTPPANTPAIRVEAEPGSAWSYSGGGYTVMQQLEIDVTGKPFAELMRALVLGPAGMTESSFQQPLPPARARATATGTNAIRIPIEGRWHVYPEMAAAGLWTTATDLARFAIEVQRAYAGKSKLLGRTLARQMLTAVKNDYGLGFGVEGEGRTLRFNHGGRDTGFDAFLVATAETGQGAAIMIAANDNSRMTQRLVAAIAAQQHWPTATPPPALAPAVTVDPATIAKLTGRYEFANNFIWTLVTQGGRLYTAVDGLPDDELVPLAADRFRTPDGAIEIAFTPTAFTWHRDGKSGTAPRIAPLAAGLAPQKDPDPALTARALAALKSLATADPAAAGRAHLAPGAAKDFTAASFPELGRITGLTFLDAQGVTGIERHGGQVARVLTYAVLPEGGPRFVLVYLTADGAITDFDRAEE